MQPYYERSGIRLYHGDAADVLPTLEAESISAVVSDPPAGIAFMSKAWDRDKGGRDQWVAWLASILSECNRAMKPGAHAVIWALPRTSGWTHRAIEDAGLDVRDCVTHLFGTGFPKSHDVSKAIDRMRNDDIRPVCRFLRTAIDAHHEHTTRSIAAAFDVHTRMVDHWAARDTDSQPAVPKWDQWLQLKDLLGFGDEMDAEVWRLNGRKGKPGDNWDKREVIGQSDNGIAGGSKQHAGQAEAWGFNGEYDITAPATPEAEQWQGWGTSLKPAAEFWYLARKPLIGAVAANVLEHGTGALNIDQTRIRPVSPSGSDRSGDHVPASLRSVQDAARHIAAALRADSNADIGLSRDAAGQGGTQPYLAQYAGIRNRLYPNGVSRDFDWTAVPDFPGDCPACRRFGDAHVHAVQAAYREGAPSLADALDDTRRALSEPARIRDCRCSGHPSSCGAVRQIASLLDLLAPNYTTPNVERADSEPNHTAGRWPSNVLLDETAAAQLDQMSGERPVSGSAKNGRPATGDRYNETQQVYGGGFGNIQGPLYNDTGGASRYFPVLPIDDPDTLRFLYTPKASRAERNAGCGHIDLERPAHFQDDAYDFTGTKNPTRSTPLKGNTHPTVKPLALMRWLLTLVTPPGGAVLDPFAGSGTTGVAAAALGIPCVLIEQEAEYLPIIAGRIDHALDERAGAELPLFAGVAD